MARSIVADRLTIIINNRRENCEPPRAATKTTKVTSAAHIIVAIFDVPPLDPAKNALPAAKSLCQDKTEG
jgi:hypothetical protein